MAKQETMLIRVDASVAIGTGHVMRCLALAQAWQDAGGGNPVFAMAETTPAVEDRLQSEGFEIVSIRASVAAGSDARQLAALAHERSAEWAVVDGYQFRAAYQGELKKAGLKVLFVDDNGDAGGYSADLVLNQNLHATEKMYEQREPYTQLLLGTRFCMLRREFSSWRGWNREISPMGRKVLITMGGSDPDRFTEAVIRSLRQVEIEGLETTVAVGGSNPNWASLQRVASEFSGSLHLHRDVADMAELMAWADAAVSAAGTTSWEMCLLGLPALLISVAANQHPLAQELNNRGCAIHLGTLQDLSAEKVASQLEQLLNSAETRSSLSRRALQLVDGNGAQRAASIMQRGNSVLRSA
jgi:UDP-2,4-diacetamido-2,4,6-trideoxy-beta-L-altropyranose hydrolase